jgi:hypothetical protein
MSFVSKSKKFAGLMAISLLAATVMPSASLATEEDLPSGDFTVEVYADLEAFGCTDSASLYFIDPERDLNTATNANIDLGTDSYLTYAGSENPTLQDLFNYYALAYDLLPEFQVNNDENNVLASVTYNPFTQGGSVDWDIGVPGVLDSEELVDNAVLLSMPRQQIQTPPYSVWYDASDCEESTSYGVLTVERSPIWHEVTGVEDIAILDFDWESEWTTESFEGKAIANIVTTYDLYGSPTGVPWYYGWENAFSTQPVQLGFDGSHYFSVLISIFGSAPAGRYAVEIGHSLYVNTDQSGPYGDLLCSRVFLTGLCNDVFP